MNTRKKKFDFGRPVYITTPRGERVVHGHIRDGKFTRFLRNKDVRWSDSSFCLNAEVVSELFAQDATTLMFKLQRATQYDIYGASLYDIVKTEPITNEHGEKNYRISIDSCYLYKSTPLNKESDE